MSNTLGPGGKEVPLSKNLLYPFAVNELAVRQQQSVQVIADTIAPRLREDFLEKSKGLEHLFTPWFLEQPIPCEFGEVDKIAFSALTTQDESFFRINCSLFSDGSPFVFDDDLERSDPEDVMNYTILLTAEFPPFMVFNSEFDDIRSITGDVRAYLDYLGEHNRSPRFLDEDAQTNIMNALKQAELDPVACVDACYGEIPQLRDYL